MRTESMGRSTLMLFLAMMWSSERTIANGQSSTMMAVANTDKSFRSEAVDIPLGQDTLTGVVYYPMDTTNTKLPGVLCLQGGGDAGLENYFLEAEFFAEQGYVALICDKSGAGGSRTAKSWIDQTFNEKIQEYMQLHAWLCDRPEVDSSRVGLHGMSEGGRLALAMALNHPRRIAFVNTVSAPLTTYKETQLFAIGNLLRTRGVGQDTVALVLQIFADYYDAVASGRIEQHLAERIEVLRRRDNRLYLPPATTALPRMPNMADINFEVGGDLRGLIVPVLAQYGAEDRIVDSAIAPMVLGPLALVRVEVYSGVDHNMTLHGEGLYEGYLQAKSTWLRTLRTLVERE